MKIFNLIVIALMFIAGWILYPALPENLPVHWNIRGQVDNYMPKSQSVWLMPVMVVLFFVLFRIIPSLDPKKEKYRLFAREWEIIQTGFIGFFAYLHFIILYLSLHPEVPIMPLMFIGIGSLFILLGNYLSKIRQNYFIGIKVPWTLADEDNWNKTHRFASWCFVIAGIVTIAEAFFFWYAPVVILGGIFLASGLPIIYSFLLFKQSLHLMKYIYLALIVLASGMFFICLHTPGV